MNERIAKILKYAKGPDILDVGCAGGGFEIHQGGSPYWLHKHLQDRFPNVVGLDIQQEAISIMQRLGYKVMVGNAEDLDLQERFDTIVAGELIEHLSNPGRFLEAAKRHLKPKGRVIITTPYPFAAMNILYAFLKFPKTCSNPEHTMWLCPSTLQELARRYGYKVLHFELVEDYYGMVESLFYRIFINFIKPLLPKRLRNNAMLFVLEAEEK